DHIIDQGGRMHGFQLWVNLPSDLKMIEPTYQEVATGGLPLFEATDGSAIGRIIAGEALGVAGDLHTTWPVTYQHWTLNPGAVFDLPVPADQKVAVLPFVGSAMAGFEPTLLAEGDLGILGDGEAVRLAAAPGAQLPAEVLLMAGKPIGEPVARYGPFVMNTEAELRQAFEDYRAGRMGRIPPG